MPTATQVAGATSLPLRNPNARTWKLTKRLLAARLFQRSRRIRSAVVHLGELADYSEWLQRHFGDVRVSRDREAVWEAMKRDISDDRLTCFEFGVAWGYATGWWLSRLRHDHAKWHGFDSFEGLPAQFRDWPPGTFSADGNVPAIDDPRLVWHVGWVEDTLPELELGRVPGERWLVLFDLDLYAPSKFAWDLLCDHLLPGDLVYFDEAYDMNERRLLDEDVLTFGKFEFVGANTQGLALRLVARA